MSVLCGTIKEKSEIELPRRKGFLFFITYRFPFNYRSGSLNPNKDEGAKRNVQRIYRRICVVTKHEAVFENRRFKCGTDHAVDLFFAGFAATEKASILQIAGSGREKSG